MTVRKSIGKEQAVKMYEREWWKGKSPRDVALVGLSLQELTLPFLRLHWAVESTLMRIVDPADIKADPEKLLLRILADLPPLTLGQIHDIAFPDRKDRVVCQEPGL
jgi:hypothetical protein